MTRPKAMTKAALSGIGESPLGPDRLTVFLHECSVNLRIGYRSHERKKRQPVIINVDIETDLLHSYQDLKENDLATVIDYSRLYHFVTDDLVKLPHIAFLETVADQIMAFCFQDKRAQKVTVRIEKPEIYKKKARAGIIMTRTNDDGAFHG